MILPREMLDASWLGFLLGVVSLSLVCVTFQGVRSFFFSPSLCMPIPLYVTFSLWSTCRGILQLFTIPSFRSLLSPPLVSSLPSCVPLYGRRAIPLVRLPLSVPPLSVYPSLYPPYACSLPLRCSRLVCWCVLLLPLCSVLYEWEATAGRGVNACGSMRERVMFYGERVREDVKCWRKGAGDMADGCFIS